MTKKGFTLIELLVVLGLIAILAAILIVIINPVKIFQRARDSQRTGDLRNLDQALTAYIVENSQTGNIYLSGTSSNAQCLGGTGSSTIFVSNAWSATGTFPAPSGNFTTISGKSSRAVDGTGWLPVNFSSVGILQLSSLPVDPTNVTTTVAYYYAYACKTDLTYELNARLEANLSAMANDGGDTNALYEVGPNKNILPNATSSNYFP